MASLWNFGSTVWPWISAAWQQVETNLRPPSWLLISQSWFRVTLYCMALWTTINTLLAKTQLLDIRLKLWYCSPITKLLTLAVAYMLELLRPQLALTSFLALGLSLVPLAMDLTTSRGLERVLWAWAVMLLALRWPNSIAGFLRNVSFAVARCEARWYLQLGGHSAHLSSITQFKTALMWVYAAIAWSKLTHAQRPVFPGKTYIGEKQTKR